MAEPPLKFTGFLCLVVTCLLVGLIVRNALRDDGAIAVPQVGSEVATTPTPDPELPEGHPPTTPQRETPPVPYASTDDGAGERVEAPEDGTRRDGREPLRVLKEGFSILLPPQTKHRMAQEGPTFILSLTLDNQPDFLTIYSRKLFPWSQVEDILSRYDPYTEGERITTEGGVDLALAGGRWSAPDDKSFVVVRGNRLYRFEAAGFGADFPEQVALLNGVEFLELPSFTERLKQKYGLTDEQLQGPAPQKVDAKVKELVEQLSNLRGGLPDVIRRPIEYYKAGDVNYRDMLLLQDYLQEVADVVAKSLRQH